MRVMRLLLLTIVLFIFYPVVGQELSGKWYSRDSARTYMIYKNGDYFEARIEKSSRIKDREGMLILRHVVPGGKQNRFEGELFSVDGLSTFAKIRFQKDGQVLRLRLRRMFFTNVTIKWYRARENNSGVVR